MPESFENASRRGFLRGSAATLATGFAAVGAGCSGLPPLGTRVRYGSVDAPAAADAAYRDWLPAPSALPEENGDADGVEPWVHVPPSADAPAWARTSIGRSLVAFRTDYVGVHVDDVDVALTFGDATVLRGPVDEATVRDVVADTPYEPVGTDGEYDVYARPDTERVVAVSTEAAVFGNGPAARETVRAVVDAGRGDVPRYHERDADLDALVDGTGMRRWAWLWPGGVGASSGDDDLRTDTVGWASSFDHDADGAYYVQTWVFPPEYDLTAGAVKESLDSRRRAGRPSATEVSAVDVTVDGRVATVEMYLSRDVVERVLTDRDLVTPHVTWRASFDADADRLTVHHAAGDPVRTDRLWVEGTGHQTDEPVAVTADVGARLEPGESITVSTADAEPDALVRLVYRKPNGHASTTLFVYDLP